MAKTLFERVNDSEFIFMDNGNIQVKNAVIIRKNFAGRENKFGNSTRTFNLCLNPEIGQMLKDDGWNVRISGSDNPDFDGLITTEIVVNMDSDYPPMCVRISELNGRTSKSILDADTIKDLDRIRFAKADIIIHPYEHNKGGYRFKGYLNKLKVFQAKTYDSFFDDVEDLEFEEL